MLKIIWLIPCLNEELTIGCVIREIRAAGSDAEIHVIDNGSNDRTRAVAEAAGAFVHAIVPRGKGVAVRRGLALEADIYLLIDGDATYDPSCWRELVAPIELRGAGMVVACRTLSRGTEAFRPFHRLGNQLITALVNRLFSVRYADCLSGFRALSAHTVSRVELRSEGFEIEPELGIQLARYGLQVEEIPCQLRSRPEGSQSKLRSIPDGLRILRLIFDWPRWSRRDQVLGIQEGTTLSGSEIMLRIGSKR